jgi:CRISPR/Cas system-associated endonuclease Cas1
MEPFRPIVDRLLLEFVQNETFSPGDVTITSKGVCRLNAQLTRNVVRLVGAVAKTGETVASAQLLLHQATRDKPLPISARQTRRKRSDRDLTQ